MLRLIQFCIGTSLVVVSVIGAMAQTQSFVISVPFKGLNTSSNPFPPIGTVKAIVGVACTTPALCTNPVTFTITPDPASAPTPASQPFPAVHPGDPAPPSLTFSYASLRNDVVSLTPLAHVADPPIYEIDFRVQSDFTVGCIAQQNARTFTVSVGPTDPQITSVCLESYDAGPGGSCSPATDSVRYIPIPPDDPKDTFATVNGKPVPTQGCFASRVPLDVLLVLDKSGSMSSATSSGLGTTRMDALHTATTNLVNLWGTLPVATGGGPAETIGVVDFDSTANQLFALTDVTVPANRTAIITDVNAITPGNSTSIGAGLILGAPLVAAQPGRRKAILLMSDGQQNTDPLADASGAQVATFCQFNSTPCGGGPVPTTKVPLPNQPPIYAVTLGPSIAQAMINQAIANKSGGFYLNTEDPGQASLLGPFFLELLQNFLKFHSYETVRLVSKATPFSTTVPISTTSHDVAVSLMWAPRRGPLRLTVTPPGGAAPIVREDASGFISVAQLLPLSAPFDPQGDWKIQVDAINPNATATAVGTAAVPFDLHIMTDDGGIKSDLAVVPGDYKPGDKIRLRARLTRFGLPITGIGSHSGDKIEVQLVRPGKSIGDILSESTASADTSGSPEPESAADVKLDNTLKNDPTVLKHESDTVQLFDDGRPEHGDDVAGDGIYSALYPATLPGHYNFLFAVESVDPNSVRFSRQQLRTAYVRPYPTASNTNFHSTITSGPDKGTSKWSIVMTPRTKAGDRMGPGWGNYFWFIPAGQPPLKPKDNLDGTYTADVIFSGPRPNVSVGFEDALAIIGDNTTFNHLPAPPTPLVGHVPAPAGSFAFFLDTGAGFPHGTFGNGFNTGFSLNAGLEYIVNTRFSVEGIFGYHHFPAKVGSNVDVYQFSVDGKVFLTSGSTQPFLNAGAGGYKFNPGSTNFGGNFGAGLLHSFTPHFGLQASYNFHVVNTPVTATRFSTLQGGVRFVF